MRRREFVRYMALLGMTPTAAQLAACADDADGSDPLAGLDASSDAGSDAGNGLSDVGDAGSDAPEVNIPDDLPEYAYDGPTGPADLFAAGVASGDPLADAVILWTFVDSGTADDVPVWWEIALDPAFTQRLQVGDGFATSATGHTFKVDVGGLPAGTTLYYRFFALGVASPIGRTRTAPRGAVDRLRFAVVSCASYTSGYYHAYRAIAERADLDAVIHLGDYIYEGGGRSSDLPIERAHRPAKTIETLDEYRERYRQYREDLSLQEVHRQHAFICVWDDHESLNNSWRDGAPTFDGDAEQWAVRKAIAWQALMEWLPIRPQDETLKIWRHLPYGDLADIVMLDTRIWDRDEQSGGIGSVDAGDTSRSILGEEQAAWLDERMCESTAQWRLIGQQVMMAHLAISGTPLNPDQWDGYPGSRNRFLNTLDRCGVDNVVVLTGDIHTSWANEVTLDPLDPAVYNPETSEGSLAVEFVCTSVTSSSADSFGSLGPFLDNATELVLESNPHMRWLDLTQKGYLLVDLDTERVQGAWFHFDDVRTPDYDASGEYFAAAYRATSGSARLEADDAPAADKPDAPALAP